MKLSVPDVVRFLAAVFVGALTAGATLWGISAKAQTIIDRVDANVVAIAEVRKTLEQHDRLSRALQMELVTVRASCCHRAASARDP